MIMRFPVDCKMDDSEAGGLLKIRLELALQV